MPTQEQEHKLNLSPTRTREEVLAAFRENGASIAKWSVDHGFQPYLVYEILRGERKCLRGQSHEIAVQLGLKPKPTRPLPP
jgi:gp16 family phage-associated protein